MRETNWQSDEKRLLSAYILIAAVSVLDLSLVYLVNVELLPLIFDNIDREVYRQTLVTMVIQTLTTAFGVFLGLLLFRLLDCPYRMVDGEKVQERS